MIECYIIYGEVFHEDEWVGGYMADETQLSGDLQFRYLNPEEYEKGQHLDQLISYASERKAEEFISKLYKAAEIKNAERVARGDKPKVAKFKKHLKILDIEWFNHYRE